MRLRTLDGVTLAGWHVPPPINGPLGPDVAVLIAHGFTGSMRRPAVQQIAAAFAASAGVLLFDLRGHGASAGLSTLGDREALDVDVGLRALRRAGYDVVVALGASMGASAVLRQAGLAGELVRGLRLGPAPDLVVAVSATSRWGVRDTAAMRRVHWMALTRPGRLVARRLGARVDPEFWADPQPPAPVDVIAGIDPATLARLAAHVAERAAAIAAAHAERGN